MNMHTNRVVIVGGGFGGVRCAMQCAKRLHAGTQIALITDKPYMQYYAALYRALAGGDPSEACVPLRDLFHAKRVHVVVDPVVSIEPSARCVCCASGDAYSYDTLVVALGSQPCFFRIPGVEAHAHTMQSLNDALRLKRHIHDVLAHARELPDLERPASANIVVIGAGATGVEVAGELAVYVRAVAAMHGIDPSAVTIDLVDALPRVLPLLPQSVSRRVAERLQRLGVHLFLGRAVQAEDAESVKLRDVVFKSRTVVWTAGVSGHSLLGHIDGVTLDKRGRVMVDEHLRASGLHDVFVIGDGAATKLSGMAQTALQDADHVADTIARRMAGKSPRSYKPRNPAYAVPVGPRWAAVVYGPLRVCGYLGWLLRRAADLKVFCLYLPLRKAISAFCSGGRSAESCAVCTRHVAPAFIA
jgi:NADH dehydrogenase